MGKAEAIRKVGKKFYFARQNREYPESETESESGSDDLIIKSPQVEKIAPVKRKKNAPSGYQRRVAEITKLKSERENMQKLINEQAHLIKKMRADFDSHKEDYEQFKQEFKDFMKNNEYHMENNLIHKKLDMLIHLANN